MLDTHGRKYVQPMLDGVADFCIKRGITANAVTIGAFIIGVSSSFLIAFDWRWPAVFVLWFSGMLDAVDGTISRKTASSSPLGTLMDIVFDRIVEISVLLSLVFVQPELAVHVMIVLSTIIISMTIFLTVGAVGTSKVSSSKTKTKKSFYYQAGVAERTEAFVMLSLAVLIHGYRGIVLLIFAAMILFTAGQRFWEAVRIFKNN